MYWIAFGTVVVLYILAVYARHKARQRTQRARETLAALDGKPRPRKVVVIEGLNSMGSEFDRL